MTVVEILGLPCFSFAGGGPEGSWSQRPLDLGSYTCDLSSATRGSVHHSTTENHSAHLIDVALLRQRSVGFCVRRESTHYAFNVDEGLNRPTRRRAVRGAWWGGRDAFLIWQLFPHRWRVIASALPWRERTTNRKCTRVCACVCEPTSLWSAVS